MNVQLKGKQGKPSVRDAIEQDIVTGFYSPGDRLDEAGLAARHQVSRTPVREALIQLSTMGLVKMVPNRGAFVTQLTITELVEMFEVMGELEAMCARLAARRIRPEQLKRLEGAQAACAAAQQAGNSDDYYYANAEFHRLIYEASGNGFLAENAHALQRRLKPYRRLQLRVPGRVNSSLSEHEEVLAAIRDRDDARARDAMRNHVVIQGEYFSDFLALMRPVERQLIPGE
ncbi:GntR family transcriptional regulator [Neorhizobium galegae]|uniref:GntR family transcriptional regulator n=1 Tax=Neorhizobium galegae TaxID=399 RepID=UPI000621A0FD|nr:GntR family transcriptional regulator [Neorhizobium galegae]CDZ56956.1 Transcriptional regulator mdcY family [Neorhizobium galegae bv. orientalis]KAB1123004.1 GntR family transcriptional regulator [Neorhizobium galegae]MCQ1569998.1 GntR family transcriptional regulator [Neorhizobium galegae]MCQ1807536.1 GntR family transcriptional regulator [Neorhizobium galegae]MCQ1838106.1 GntR family transcriptional regulator [Neorhizobium galegae]